MSRPVSVTITTLGVLTISIYHWTRLAQAIQQWQFLNSLETTVPPAYLAVTGLVFGLAGLVPVVGLWFGRHWAPRATIAYMGILILYDWVDRLFLEAPLARTANWPFALGISLGVLVGLSLVFARPPIRAYFKRNRRIK